jgi:ABC-2 type transport system permease protein
MFSRLGPTIIKELLTFFRDPSSRRMMFIMPLVQLLLFSYAATMEVRNVDIAIIDHDTGRWSHELVARVEAARFVGTVRRVRNMGELQQLVQQREVLIGLHFQADFSRQIMAGRTGPVQLIVDGRRANAGQIAFSYISAIAGQLDLELSRYGASAGAQPLASVRHWFNPNLNYTWFIVPSLIATLSMMVPLLMTGLSVARERELGTFDQLLVSPVSSFEIILGKILPAFLAGMFVGIVIFVLAVSVYGIPFHGNLLLLLLSMSVFVLCIVGVGLTISTACSTQQQAALGMFSILIPSILISGFLTPVENQPEWFQYIAEVSPLKHFIIILQGSFLKTMNVSEIFENLWPMLLIAVASLGIATFAVRRGLE